MTPKKDGFAVTRITLDSGRAGAGAAESRGALRICKCVKAVLSLQKANRRRSITEKSAQGRQSVSGGFNLFQSRGSRAGPRSSLEQMVMVG